MSVMRTADDECQGRGSFNQPQRGYTRHKTCDLNKQLKVNFSKSVCVTTITSLASTELGATCIKMKFREKSM